MSLWDEFSSRVAVVEAARGETITPRLVGLWRWMKEQVEVQTVLNDLTTRNSPLVALINGEDEKRYAKAASLAGSLEEIAFVGMTILECCRPLEYVAPPPEEPNKRGFQIKITTSTRSNRNDLDEVAVRDFGLMGDMEGHEASSEIAMRLFIRPFLNYVHERLPGATWNLDSPSSVISVPFVPVAIQESLKQFQADHPNPEKSAFIMMQFSDTTAHTKIEAAIKATLKKYDFTGLLARDKEYHDEMLPNIQTYMHGCGFGIAVFERIQKEVFNPNVSLEVGYMLALKKRVLFLKDQTLTALHTDLVGKLYRPFDVLHPGTIPGPLEAWMEEKGLI